MDILLAPLFLLFMFFIGSLFFLRILFGKNIYERFMGHWLFYISKSMVHSISRITRKFFRLLFSLFTKVDSLFK